MSAKSCCVPNCKSSGFKDGEKLCSFPSAEDKRLEWIQSIRDNTTLPETWKPSESSFVCQLHFERTCFVKDPVTQTQRMTKGSLPTIFPKRPVVQPKKHVVSIIQTRRAAGIQPKARVFYEAEPQPPTRRREPQVGHTFRPVINRTVADDGAPPVLQRGPAKTQVVVITSDAKSGGKRIVSPVALTNQPPLKKGSLASCGNCAQMQDKLNQKAIAIRDLEIRISELKQELTQQDMTRKAAANKIERLKESLKEIYSDHQLNRLCDGTTRGRPWDLETTRRAAKLVLACGRNGYQELLNQGQPFPSLKTLNRLLYKRRYLSATIDNPDPAIAAEMREELSDTDPEYDSEGSAEEIEENIVQGEEGRILKKSRRTRKLRYALQKSMQSMQPSKTASDQEESMLDGVATISEDQLLLQQMDIPEEEQPTLVSQYDQIQESASHSITGDLIESILSEQNLTPEDVQEIKFDGTYVTIIKKQDTVQEDDSTMISQVII